MVVIDLPYGTLFVCKLCGESATSEDRIRPCAAVVPFERSEYNVGEVVELRSNAWQRGPDGIDEFTDLKSKPETWKILKLFYGRPSDSLALAQASRALKRSTDSEPSPHHRLFVGLSHTDPHSNLTKFWTLSYEEMKMRIEGNLDALAAAGLIRMSSGAPQLQIVRD